MDNTFEKAMAVLLLVSFGYLYLPIAIFLILLMSWGPSKKKKGRKLQND